MRRRILRHRPSPAMVIACVALAIALGGTSYAAITLPAASVGTKQLKKNAVVSSKVKNGSLLAADFKRGQVPKGAQGIPGTPGAKGDKGDKGDKGETGPIGPSDARFANSGTDVLNWTAAAQTVQSLALTAGKWVVLAKVLANNNTGGQNPSIDCHLSVGATVIDDGFDVARVGDTAADDREYFSYFGTIDLASADTANLVCTSGAASGNWLNRRIVAIRVGSLG